MSPEALERAPWRLTPASRLGLLFDRPALNVAYWHIANGALVASKVRYGVEPNPGSPTQRVSGIGASRPLLCGPANAR
jgi:hypothetical protein